MPDLRSRFSCRRTGNRLTRIIPTEESMIRTAQISVTYQFTVAVSDLVLTSVESGSTVLSAVPRERIEGNAEEATSSLKTAAAPATVGGEPRPNRHWGNLGRRSKAETRKPGDLPPQVP